MSELFDLLSKIDRCDIDYYKNLPIEEQKKLYLFLVQRWMTGTNDPKQILYINSFSNNKIFKMYHHPDLVYKLLCSASTGSKRYKWLGRKKKSEGSLSLDIIQRFYKTDYKDAIEIEKIVDESAILDMAETLGVEKETIVKLKKELKKS